jgi:hypothetical protein
VASWVEAEEAKREIMDSAALRQKPPRRRDDRGAVAAAQAS